MGRILLGFLTSLLVVCSLPARANPQEPPLFDLALHPPKFDNRWTLQESPSLCRKLITNLPAGSTVMFTLMDASSIKPVLEIQLANAIQTEKRETCFCVNLKDYNIQLKPYLLYRWYLSIAQNPEPESQEVVDSGLIERCGKQHCGIREEPSRCDESSSLVLAESRIFYDSISCLCDLIKSAPEDKSLRWKLDALMRRALQF